VTTRSYLSIGDVLTLLRQEFPDVTISKIRFLESQGLVNPERTPSGYRKFYEHDVERLRWVLRQQREHFLPLKVIKDRLGDDDGGGGPVRVAAGAAPAVKAPPVVSSGTGQHGTPADGPPTDEPVLVGQRAASQPGPGMVGRRREAEGVPAARADGPTLPGIESAFSTTATGTAVSPAGPSPNGPNGPGAAGAGGPVARPVGSLERPTPVPSTDEPSPADAGPARPAPATAAAASADPPTRRTRTHRAGQDDSADGPAARPSTGRGAAKRASAAAGSVPPAPAPAPPEGVSLSVEELAAACGLDPSVLLELRDYGLVTATTVAGLEYYDADALAVATMAAGFARFGIEPRHLRLYKNAADREAGFVEQVVLPLVRQRNPEARTRAQATADELTQLGQELRGALLRRSLRDLLEG
jgi:DNA-binding transcriptional MerR regulator